MRASMAASSSHRSIWAGSIPNSRAASVTVAPSSSARSTRHRNRASTSSGAKPGRTRLTVPGGSWRGHQPRQLDLVGGRRRLGEGLGGSGREQPGDVSGWVVQRPLDVHAQSPPAGVAGDGESHADPPPSVQAAAAVVGVFGVFGVLRVVLVTRAVL